MILVSNTLIGQIFISFNVYKLLHAPGMKVKCSPCTMRFDVTPNNRNLVSLVSQLLGNRSIKAEDDKRLRFSVLAQKSKPVDRKIV